ncbi:MAG: MBL fold metallo-hydrolase RNA specificity domain-containing protein [Planctomycetota bacterium JB042]
MPPTIRFLGAAGTVTGSRFLIESGEKRLLIDCGLFQGPRELRQRNWEPMPIEPSTFGAVVLTHGHIDHCGYLPRIVKRGFSGPVYGTPATAGLLEIMLPDAAHLQEEEARYRNKKGYTKHKPALPLYTKEDAREALGLVRTAPYQKPFTPVPGFEVTLHPSGHILGAVFVEVNVGGRRIVVSGDIGGYDRIVMGPPAPLPPDVDHVLVESTYGGRSQDHRPVQDQLEEHIAPALARGGVVVIPAFAVGRTTLILYHLRQLMEKGRLPDVPVFVDSPMATDAVELYCKFGDEHNLRVDLLKSGSCPIVTPQIKLIRKVEESKELNHLRGPAIIVSASGMATGGRVVHHLKNRLPHRDNLVLLVGYQAMGTRGRRILDGADDVRIFGRDVPIRAEVASIRGLSAHGDADDILRWLGTARRPPRMTFLVHGEEDGLKAMAKRVKDELGWKYAVPRYLESVPLD